MATDGGGSKGLQRSKSQALAAWLKAHGIERTTGMCPRGCGRAIAIGGPALVAHLGHCDGSRRYDRRS